MAWVNGDPIAHTDLNTSLGGQRTTLTSNAALRFGHYISIDAYTIAAATDKRRRSRAFRPRDDMHVRALRVRGFGGASGRTLRAFLEVDGEEGTNRALGEQAIEVTLTATGEGDEEALFHLPLAGQTLVVLLAGVTYRLVLEASAAFSHAEAALSLQRGWRRR